MNGSPRIVEVRKNILKRNDIVAGNLRERFKRESVFVASLVSSPGAGKTLFLEKLMALLNPKYRVAALVGDLATENDAQRLVRSGSPAKQIVTGTVCHLEAAMIEQAISDWDVWPLDFLFIENVGNLVCPSSYDLAENLRLVLLSVTEGEDKPLKYPSIFNGADAAIITKTDLASAAEFDSILLESNLQAVRPAICPFYVCAKNGDGMHAFRDFLVAQMLDWRPSLACNPSV